MEEEFRFYVVGRGIGECLELCGVGGRGRVRRRGLVFILEFYYLKFRFVEKDFKGLVLTYFVFRMLVILISNRGYMYR